MADYAYPEFNSWLCLYTRLRKEVQWKKGITISRLQCNDGCQKMKASNWWGTTSSPTCQILTLKTCGGLGLFDVPFPLLYLVQTKLDNDVLHGTLFLVVVLQQCILVAVHGSGMLKTTSDWHPIDTLALNWWIVNNWTTTLFVYDLLPIVSNTRSFQYCHVYISKTTPFKSCVPIHLSMTLSRMAM